MYNHPEESRATPQAPNGPTAYFGRFLRGNLTEIAIKKVSPASSSSELGWGWDRGTPSRSTGRAQSFLNAAELGVQGVAHPVAKEVEGEDDDGDGQAGEEG